VLYWLVNNILQIGQQWLINRDRRDPPQVRVNRPNCILLPTANEAAASPDGLLVAGAAALGIQLGADAVVSFRALSARNSSDGRNG